MSDTALTRHDWESTSVANVDQPRYSSAVASKIIGARMFSAVEHTADAADIRSASAPARPAMGVARARVANFTALQEWDGYVVSMNGDSFTARLTDITIDGAADAEEVEIPYEELDEASVHRMEPGSLFRWSIGYERSLAGQKTRVSRIILRQLPRWRKDELAKANREAAELVEAIKWQE